MFKYIKFNKVTGEFTIHEFRGGDDKVKVNHFDVDVVSLEAESEADIDALVSSQVAEIACETITQDEFKTMVANSSQLKRIRQVVKGEIAKVYDSADEIAMSKRADDDSKRVRYEEHVQKSLSVGYALKMEIGY